MAYEVRLDVFEGPIDLLLHLITRQRVDVYDVSIATITDEYLRALARMPDLDLESATGFLVVAAALLELKSARLLPAHEDDDPDDRLLEERDVLLSRLVETSTFRAAGEWLWGRLDAGAAYHARPEVLEEPFVHLAPDPLASVSAGDLADAAAALLAPAPRPDVDVSHVTPGGVGVREAIADLCATLQSRSRFTFAELCEDAGRTEVVVRFLALLELFKAGAVDVEQAHRFGDITASWTGEVAAEDVLQEADDYAATGTRR